ncbi:uncharacterized protein LOC108912345 [Anoplophora glabripennis]|uniref:uncharacterized protein LOC108912345 n=1 Tax=Anoplophora glabripennis TaxID=217634 RepID=UPI0008747D94|nr:uncharacterized protein LOC108912345 [Anoplophora glabripennis]
MNYIRKQHTRYLDSALESSKLDPNPYSIVPTLIFLSCTFVLLYFHLHRYTFPSTRWKTRLYKDAVFHWIYFYLVRIWFLFMKLGRYLLSVLDNYIEMTSPKEEIFVNQTINHALIFMFALTLSTVPFLILCVSQVTRRNIPNFLMWVAEDPWIRSEIGTSGHYLQRPARIAQSYKNRNSAYRSRRSTSVDTDIFDQKQLMTSRPCKSMVTLNVVKSINGLAE